MSKKYSRIGQMKYAEFEPNKARTVASEHNTCSMRKLHVVILGVFLFFVLGCYYSFSDLVDNVFYRPNKLNVDIHSKGFLVDGPGCSIPNLDAFDPLIESMIWTPEPLVCNTGRPQLVRADLTSLSVVKSRLKVYGIKNVAKLRCCYRVLRRRQESEVENVNKIDDYVRYSNSCTPFSSGATPVAAEFVRVECRYGAKKIYVDYFAFTPLKQQVEERCLKKDSEYRDSDSLSVLIVGIDSVSRINFHRQMPETDKFLRSLDAIEMLGYNKIGDNTYPNLLGVLSGLTILEAQKTCWSVDAPTFDTCPFIWKNFSRAGFRTAFAEDDAIIGTFNYNSRCGFVSQPTDYYMRPFHVSYNRAKGSKAEDHDGKLCVGTKANVDVLLNYTTSFATTMSSRRYFGLFWQSTVTHDNLNDAQQLDGRLSSTLRHLSAAGSLNNTLLIVMSDHGLRFGDIRTTFQGWLEERLPLLTFTFPVWFKNKYPEAIANLEGNVRQLTTPFDLHRTLADFLDVSQLTSTVIRKRAEERVMSRDQSLFLPVSEQRTCGDAGVDIHWCTCQQSQSVSVDDSKILAAARFIVTKLNTFLSQHPECARLEVKKVLSARRRFVIGKEESLLGDIEDYVVVVEAEPSRGMFEATVRQTVGGWEFANAKGLDVSRLNVYGTQSWCVDESQAKLYCFCRKEPKGL